MDDEKVVEALRTLGVAPAAKELYIDLLRPAAAESGKNLLLAAKLVTIALTPLQGMVWGFEKIRDWLAASLLKRLSKTDPEQIQPPPSYIAGQILLQLPFCAEQEQLRELYANLLAAAMKKDTVATVHPAFVQVIQQLAPDEALILERMAASARPFSVSETWSADGGPSEDTESISKQFRKFCEGASVSTCSLSDTYLDNLLRLKILTEQRWTEGKFHPPGYADHGEYPAHIENRDGRLVETSTFGDEFIHACVLSGNVREPG
jgi:hypothetical protein